MSIKIANHLVAIPPSPTLALSSAVKAKIAAGEDVIDLSAGEPDFPLPAAFAKGIREALDNGHTTYPPVAGIPRPSACSRPLRPGKSSGWGLDRCGTTYTEGGWPPSGGRGGTS